MSTESKRCTNILIVEDEPGIREVLRDILEIEGYHVSEASNGQEGLEVLKSVPRPCLVLLDLMMPVMNGWEFAKAMESDLVLAQIPIAIVSAFEDKEKTIKARAVVKKPVDIETLLKTVNQFCG